MVTNIPLVAPSLTTDPITVVGFTAPAVIRSWRDAPSAATGRERMVAVCTLTLVNPRLPTVYSEATGQEGMAVGCIMMLAILFLKAVSSSPTP